MSLINQHTLGLSSLPTMFGAGEADPAFPGFLRRAPQETPARSGPLFSTIYAFGDSLSDAGNDYLTSHHLVPTPAIYSQGRFTNGNVWLQDLAQSLGLAIPQASLGGGTDYAYGGAETGLDPLHALSPTDLPAQLLQFEADHAHPAANALYTISIGANDLLDAIPAYASDPVVANQDVQAAVANETQFVQSLIDWGATTFDILNVPDLGKTPVEIDEHTSATATSLSGQYDAAIATSLAQLATQDHVAIHIVDAFSLLDQVVADPSGFGFTNVTTPVWTGNVYNPLSGRLNAHGSAQNDYLFFDHLHPTAAGHSIIASAALAALGQHS